MFNSFLGLMWIAIAIGLGLMWIALGIYDVGKKIAAAIRDKK